MQGSSDAISDGVDPSHVVFQVPVPAEDEENNDGKERDGDDDADDDRRQNDVGQPVANGVKLFFAVTRARLKS